MALMTPTTRAYCAVPVRRRTAAWRSWLPGCGEGAVGVGVLGVDAEQACERGAPESWLTLLTSMRPGASTSGGLVLAEVETARSERGTPCLPTPRYGRPCAWTVAARRTSLRLAMSASSRPDGSVGLCLPADLPQTDFDPDRGSSVSTWCVPQASATSGARSSLTIAARDSQARRHDEPEPPPTRPGDRLVSRGGLVDTRVVRHLGSILRQLGIP